MIFQRIQNDDTRNREICSARMQNIVSARSQGHPRINDIAVNNKTLGITVQPCRIHMNMQKDDQLVTWKQISRKKDNFQADDPVINHNFSREFQLLDLDRLCNREEGNENRNKTEGDLSIIEDNFIRIDKDSKVDKVKNNDNITWLSGIQNLNQTYLIKNSEDIEPSEIFHSKWKPIKHSPRVEFYLKDKEDEICEFDKKKSKRETVANNLKDKEDEVCKFDQKKLKRETIANDLKDREDEIYEFDQRKSEREIVADNLKDREDEICKFDQKKSKRKIVTNDEKIRIEQVKELKMCIKDKENDNIPVECKVEKLKTNNKSIKNIQKINSEKIEVVAHTTEELNINTIEKNRRVASYEETKITENDIEKIEINTSIKEGTKEIEKINIADITELDKLNVYKEDKKGRQITMNEIIIENTKYTKEIEQNLSESDQLIKSSLFNVTHSTASNVSKKKNFIDQSQDCLNSKDEVPHCESDTRYNNSLELKESIATFICDQPNINEITSLNNSNNQADCNSSPENETLACQSRNSLDLIENIKKISFPASSPIVTPKKNCTRNVEEIKIDEERYENGLTNICNKKPKRNSKKLKCEVYSLPQNSEIADGNYLNASMNKISLHVKNNRQFQEKNFSSDNIGNIENNTKNGKTDFNTDSDNSCSNNKSSLLDRSIIKAEITTAEGLRKKNVDSEFDYGSDNTVLVEEYNRRSTDGLGSSVTLTDYAEEQSQCRGSEIFLNAGMNFPKCAYGAAKRAAREQSVNSIEMKHRIKESMNLLRGSTDSLISSVEFVELASIRRPKANCAYEQEIIEIIRPNKRYKVFKDLPDIKGDAAEMKEDSEGSYWERTSKISQNRLTNLYPTCHMEYKLTKRNPRVRILPPVLNPFSINQR